jgi:N-acetylneuraminic acid mutarotase
MLFLFLGNHCFFHPVFDTKITLSTGVQGSLDPFRESSSVILDNDTLIASGGLVSNEPVLNFLKCEFNTKNCSYLRNPKNNLNGVYKKVGDDAQPSARYAHKMILLSNQIIVLFGGFGLDATHNTVLGILNDLWLYNISSDKWYWKHGNESSLPNVGVYSADGRGYPYGRQKFGFTAINNDSIFLFGGLRENKNHINDFWRYDYMSNQWFWISGNGNTSDFNTNDTHPGPRFGHSMIKLVNNSLLVFGGSYYNNSIESYLNDLWMYNPQLNIWKNIKNKVASYKSDGTGYPFPRSDFGFVPLKNDSIILFGGYGNDSIIL